MKPIRRSGPREGIMPEREDVATGDVRDIKADVAKRLGEAVSDAKRGARQMADEASQTVRDARERVAETYGRTAATAERAYLDARRYATEHPGTAAAVTFAAGIGVGMMLAPRAAAGVARRGLMPVVAVALAHAVLDVFDPAR
jgi:ElaB/YqjD/DUF883 family membrane-anchored ribosome-binding protein